MCNNINTLLLNTVDNRAINHSSNLVWDIRNPKSPINIIIIAFFSRISFSPLSRSLSLGFQFSEIFSLLLDSCTICSAEQQRACRGLRDGSVLELSRRERENFPLQNNLIFNPPEKKMC